MRIFFIKTVGFVAGACFMMLLWWLVTFICSFIVKLWNLMWGRE